MLIKKKIIHLFRCDLCDKIMELEFETKKSYLKVLRNQSRMECDCSGTLKPLPN